jgi:hypothetical protein
MDIKNNSMLKEWSGEVYLGRVKNLSFIKVMQIIEKASI